MSHPLKLDTNGNITLEINVKTFLKVLVVLVLAVGAGFLPLPGLTMASRICMVLFVAAAGLWITEAIRPFATAVMVIVLSIYLLGKPEGLLGLDRVGYQIFLNPIASPVLVLFFGGFVLALAASKHGLDVRLARAFIKPFGTHPRMVLLAIILTTGLFSMFMSNTATTAMMIAIMSPLFKHFEGRDPFKKAMVLAIPFAANIGGMGTIIGTPPNAVAASVLISMGHPVSFLKWMVVGVPFATVMLFSLWIFLVKVFKPCEDHFEILFPEQLAITWDLVTVVLTFCVTILLWLTEPIHGIPAAVVALLPVMIFTMFGIINSKDLKSIEWDVLILVAGGLTLGVAMNSTGLANVLVNRVSIISISPLILVMVMVFFSILLSNFMSNTSASNIMIPIVTSLAVVNPQIGAFAVAFACSLSMSLPISTPPNAIAFATHAIETKELVKYGTLMSLIGIVGILILLILLHQLWL